MNELFAAEPSSCENFADLQMLLYRFGPQAGRYLLEYPKKSWCKEVVERFEFLGPVEAERVKTLLRRAKEKAVLLRLGNLPWTHGEDWVENVRKARQLDPSAIDRAVVSRKRLNTPEWTLDDLNLNVPLTAGELLPGRAHNYVRATRTFLKISPELIFVDPYLDPTQKRVLVVLASMLRTAKEGKCQRVVCWARCNDVLSRSTWHSVGTALTDLLAEIAWPSNIQFAYHLINDTKSQEKMHGRYLLSIYGGVYFDRGFQELGRGQRNDVGPIGLNTHGELWRLYHENEHDMSTELTFEQ